MSDTYKTADSFIKVKIKKLEERLETGNSQYAALNQQYTNDLDAGRKVLIAKQIKDLENELIGLEIEIIELKKQLGETPKNQNWEASLHKIDFKEVSSAVNSVLSRIENGGAALFLLQEYNRMGGKWCTTLIRELLDPMHRDVRPYQIEFLPYQMLDESALLFRLGSYLNIDPSITDRQQYIFLIIDKMCDLLQIGSTIFIELRFTDNLIGRENFLYWFISEFWQPLTRRVHNLIEERPKIRFVFLVSANVTLSPSHLSYSLTCTKDEFDTEKILELQLEKWKEEEIKDWLYSFSNLGLDCPKYERMARSIYETSNDGLPIEVYSSLFDSFNPNISENT